MPASRRASTKEPRLLYMTRDDLMRHGADSITENLFPETTEIGGMPCKLSYRFEPGHPLDGVTLTVPLHLLNQLDATRFDWLVPGTIREKLTALINSLPNRLLSSCVPLLEFFTAALCAFKPGQQPLLEALAAFTQNKT